MLNIVQDSALLESIGAQTETVRLFIYSTVFYDAKKAEWWTGHHDICVFVLGEYRWEPHDCEESESQPYQQWH